MNKNPLRWLMRKARDFTAAGFTTIEPKLNLKAKITYMSHK